MSTHYNIAKHSGVRTILTIASLIGSAYVMTKVSPLLKEAAEKQKQA